jgi:TIR domain
MSDDDERPKGLAQQQSEEATAGDPSAVPRIRRRTAKRPPTRMNVFISYRREDSAALARHLFESLAARFGEDKVFFDRSTIDPGAAFPERIASAAAASGVMLAVIGQEWLEPEDGARKPRIHDARDWVRQEIELGLRSGARVIPVLIDGATIPSKADLPHSLAALPTLNAITIPWHESITALSKIIAEVTDASSRFDLTASLRGREKSAVGRNAVLNAMEISLARQGELVTLDDQDLVKKFEEVTKRPITQGALRNEIMYVVDRVGIVGKTKRGARRTYTARAYRLKSLGQIPSELEKGRPIVTGLVVHQKWFSPEVTKSGLIDDWQDPGMVRGGIVTAFVGFNPGDGSIRFITRLRDWGENGLGKLTAAAAKRFINNPDAMYSIEAAEMVSLKSKFRYTKPT